MGAQGGFVVGPTALIEFLRNRARTFVYATALAVPVAAAAVAGLRVLTQDARPREALEARSRQLFEGLRRLAACRVSHPSHIVPIALGSVQRASQVSERLWERGQWCPAIRPPTVPRGQARIRLSVTALHSPEQVEQLIAALHEVLIST